MAGTTIDYKDGFVSTGYVASAQIGPFVLLGGKYAILASDSGTTDIALYILDAGGNYVPVAGYSTASYDTQDFPRCSIVALVGVSATAANLTVVKIPYQAT